MDKLQEKINKRIGLNITEIRKELGFSQKDLGKQLDISQRALCSYECGTRTFPLFLLPKTAKILNVSVEKLLDIEGSVILDGRTKHARILKELEKVEKLPANEQKVVFTLIDSLAGKQTTAHA